jgi:hypothetical protein
MINYKSGNFVWVNFKKRFSLILVLIMWPWFADSGFAAARAQSACTINYKIKRAMSIKKKIEILFSLRKLIKLVSFFTPLLWVSEKNYEKEVE